MPSTRPIHPLLSAVDFGSSWIFWLRSGLLRRAAADLGCDDLTLPDVYFMFVDVFWHTPSVGNLISQLSVEAERFGAYHAAQSLRDAMLAASRTSRPILRQSVPPSHLGKRLRLSSRESALR